MNLFGKFTRIFKILILLIAGSANFVFAEDPEGYVSKHTLSNGLKVFLSAKEDLKTISVSLSVDTGFSAESRENISVAHLLEHMLFRSSQLDGDLTYLSLFKDDSSEINAVTNLRDTTYYANHKSEKLTWVLEQFSAMLFDRQTDLANQLFLKKEKQTVRLERGELSWVANLLGTDILAGFGKLFEQYDFNKTEFGIDQRYFSRDQELLSLKKLTSELVVDFYNKYYYPKNMTLVVAGGFDRKSILTQIEALFGQAKTPGDILKLPDLVPQVRKKQFQRLEYSSPNNFIFYGLKYHDISHKDLVLLDTYFEHLKDRLMKTIRDENGETYSVKKSQTSYGSVNITGYKAITFDTPFEKLKEHTDYVENILLNEMEKGEISDDEILTSIDKKLNKYHLNDITTKTLNNAAWSVAYYDQFFEEPYNPNAWLRETRPEDYREVLNRLYDHNALIKSVRTTHWLFKHDTLVFSLIILLFSFVLVYKLFKQEYDITKTNEIIRLTHSPWMIVEILVIIIITSTIYSIVILRFHEKIIQSDLIFKYGYLPQLLTECLGSIIYFVFLFMVLRLFIKQIFVKDSGITLNYLGLKINRINYSEISSISAKSIFLILFDAKILKKIKWRFYGNWFFFWRKLIYLELNDGRAYAFATKNSDNHVALMSENILAPYPTNE